MNILITGGLSSLGLGLTYKLYELGHKVRVFDFFDNSYKLPKDVDFIQGDILESSEELYRYLKDTDIVYHLTSLDPKKCDQNFHSAYRINIEGTLNLLDLSHQANVNKFIFLSSCAVYGDVGEEDIPVKETYVKPISSYGIIKAISELLCSLYFRKFKLNTIIIRLFSIYGSKIKSDRELIPFVVSSLHKDGKVKIYGDGKQTRDFLHIDDAVEGIISTSLNGKRGEKYNIASGVEHSIIDVIKLCAPLINKDVNNRESFIEAGNVSSSINRMEADISKAKDHFGWYPKISLETGLKLYIEWYLDSEK